MPTISMSTEILPQADSQESWREAICKVIHQVQVRNLAPQDFAARISGRGYGIVSCASFWSKSHQVYSKGERYSDTGSAGYLLSWQLEGTTHIEQEKASMLVHPGSLAIVDARRPMSITFPKDVRRIVAKLPAVALEQRLPMLRHAHSLNLTPPPGMGQILLAYLRELAEGGLELSSPDAALLADNISNVLQIIMGGTGLGALDSLQLRQRSVLQYLKQHACDGDLSLDKAASHFNVSRRLLQQTLQDMDTSFTQVVASERMSRAAELLSQSREPISQVAYRCGFNDVSHFNHLFKRAHGFSPSAYRRKYGDEYNNLSAF